MSHFMRRTFAHPALAILSTLLWGLVELMALQSSRRAGRSNKLGH